MQKVLISFILGAALFLPHVVAGKTVNWNYTDSSGTYYYKFGWYGYQQYGIPSNTSQSVGYAKGLEDPNYSILYGANVYNQSTGGQLLADNSVIPIGTSLRFEPKSFDTSDISWFGTGFSGDSPNGEWVNNAGPSHDSPNDMNGDQGGAACRNQDYVGAVVANTGGNWNVHIPLSINPPSVSVSHAGTATLACDATQRNCTVTGPGTINSSFTFAATYGKLYYRYMNTVVYSAQNPLADLNNCNNFPTIITGDPNDPQPCQFDIQGCFGDNSPMRKNCTNQGCGNASDYELQVPQQIIPFTFTVPSNNNPPSAPTLTGPTTGSTSVAYPYATQASDPDGDTVRYGIDWDNNNTVDEWTGYVASNTSATTNHSWAAPGSYTFKALTQDSNGATSGFSTPLTMTIGSTGNCPKTAYIWTGNCGDMPPDFTCGDGERLNISGSPAILCQPIYGAETIERYNPGQLSCAADSNPACNTIPVDGTCGAANNFPTTNPPSIGLCFSGTNTPVTPGVAPGPYSWSCTGSGGGSTATCSAPYLQPAPVVDLKINGSDGPLTVNRNSNLNITWGSIPYAATCTGTGNNWNGNKFTTGGNDNVAATAASLYTLTCINSQGTASSDSISVTLQPTLKICENSCNSSIEPPSSFTMIQGSTKNLVSCYNDAVSCTDPTGNVTSSTTWNEGGGPVVTLTNTDPKTVNASAKGTESISASYSSQNQNRDVTVTCTDAGACSRDPQTQNLCANETFTTVDLCGDTVNCNGSKSCDYNWKEVAPN